MKKEVLGEKGITLVALVVTIVVLLILAGISISLVLGQNGIITKSRAAKDNTEIAKARESFQMLISEYEMDKLDNANLSFTDYMQSKGADAVTTNTDGNYDVIYEGYEYTVDKNTLAILEESKEGPRPTVSNVRVVTNSDGTGTSVADGSTVDGTTLYINFDTAIDNGTITKIEPSKPYAVTENGTYKFTITGKVEETESKKTYKLDVKKFKPATISDVTTVSEAKTKNATATTANTTIKDDSGNNVVIPSGFKIASDSATNASNGVVIEDASGNQFVWIPVGSSSAMYKAETKTLTTATSVSTNYYSLFRIRSVESWTATTPGSTSGIREPDLLTSYDTDSQYYSTILGYADTTAMATAFVKDYKDMIDSVNTNKGFYVGRYELTGSVATPTEKAGTTLAGINWYNLYKACKNVETGNSHAITSMMWGCQYDEIMSWLKATVFKTDTSKVDTDSSSWGNYGPSGSAIATGSNPTYKANNIYDLAGNYYEWTQEAGLTDRRILRGGSYFYSGSGYPASNRANDNPSSNYGLDSSRSVLYIK